MHTFFIVLTELYILQQLLVQTDNADVRLCIQSEISQQQLFFIVN